MKLILAMDPDDISPTEDLMQEHGLLNRILLIYEASLPSLNTKLEIIHSCASIIRTFIEDYHEKNEEKFIFSAFKAGHPLRDLVGVLKQNHEDGRKITDRIMSSKVEVVQTAIPEFLKMYRRHEALEDTVVYPAFRKLVSKEEFYQLGRQFESEEQKLDHGFGDYLKMVEQLETDV
jgi:hemerythrin-like domain-containing protein